MSSTAHVWLPPALTWTMVPRESGTVCAPQEVSPQQDTDPASSTAHVTCTTPAYATGGTIDIELSTNNHDYTSNNMMFEYVTPVTVTSLTPESAFQGGGVLVTVYGSNFGPFPMCQFGSETAEFGIKESETRIVCESPLKASLGLPAR